MKYDLKPELGSESRNFFKINTA